MVYEMYDIPLGLRGMHPNNSQSVVAFEEQYISLEDLKSFFNFAGMPYQDPVIIGKNDPTNPGGESTLDIQWVMAIGAGIPSYFWSVSGPGPVHGGGAYILTWAMQIADTLYPPLVTSISYGDTEQGFFDKFGNYSYIDRMNDELSKMALRGLTVIAGSGDAGASNVGEAGNDISDTDPTCTPMRPFFPSNSPYVLSVSSTFFSVNTLPICQQKFEDHPLVCSEVGEIAVSVRQGTHWTTGGGFSNLTATPVWQQQAVNNYLNLAAGTLPPSQYWNSAGRGYPDVATVGFNLFVVWGGNIVSIGGTSASGPILAGIIAMINDLRLQRNKGPLGLINPVLYAQHTASIQNLIFKDIVVGENFDGDLQARDSPYPTFCPYGFITQVGWDPVTGLGTPNFRYLSEYLTSLN
uniref:Peptidase S53 domain-containing protein n=1 Tax=Arcella intermedia TaxID=1963864 RepID=A0A6B2L5D1_9EUKA